MKNKFNRVKSASLAIFLWLGTSATLSHAAPTRVEHFLEFSDLARYRTKDIEIISEFQPFKFNQIELAHPSRCLEKFTTLTDVSASKFRSSKSISKISDIQLISSETDPLTHEYSYCLKVYHSDDEMNPSQKAEAESTDSYYIPFTPNHLPNWYPANSIIGREKLLHQTLLSLEPYQSNYRTLEEFMDQLKKTQKLWVESSLSALQNLLEYSPEPLLLQVKWADTSTSNPKLLKNEKARNLATTGNKTKRWSVSLTSSHLILKQNSDRTLNYFEQISPLKISELKDHLKELESKLHSVIQENINSKSSSDWYQAALTLPFEVRQIIPKETNRITYNNRVHPRTESNKIPEYSTENSLPHFSITPVEQQNEGNEESFRVR